LLFFIRHILSDTDRIVVTSVIECHRWRGGELDDHLCSSRHCHSHWSLRVCLRVSSHSADCRCELIASFALAPAIVGMRTALRRRSEPWPMSHIGQGAEARRALALERWLACRGDGSPTSPNHRVQASGTGRVVLMRAQMICDVLALLAMDTFDSIPTFATLPLHFQFLSLRRFVKLHRTRDWAHLHEINRCALCDHAIG
jgi:hypothetical protein